MNSIEHGPSYEVLSADEILERYNKHPVALLQTYEYFNQTGDFATKSKSEFLELASKGTTPSAPDFEYPKIETEKILSWRDDLTQMLEEISTVDLSVESNRLIRENITTRLAEMGVILLTKLQSELGVNDGNYALVSWQLKENMQEVYGAPVKEDFDMVLSSRLDSLKTVMTNDELPTEILDIAKYVNNLFPSVSHAGQIYEPKAETIKWYSKELYERCSKSIDAVTKALEEKTIILNSDSMLDCENIILATQIVLDTYGCSGWTAKSKTSSSVDTSQVDKTIYIPESRTLTIDDFNEIIVSHEIDEHVARRINGDATNIPILGGLGCTDYLQWEEGNGKTNEALIAGSPSLESSAYGYFLSGGLIMGLDQEDGLGRNFGETFDIIWRINFLDKVRKGKVDETNIQANISQTMDKAYDHLRRLFRGTDGKARGVFYSKDSVNYYLGQVEVWRKWDKDMIELDEDSRRKEHKLERSAKINPLRPDHRRVALSALR